MAAVLRTRVQTLILQGDRKKPTPENWSQTSAHMHTQDKTHENTLNKVVLEIKI